MSPSDSLPKTREKMLEYVENGALLGWLISRHLLQMREQGTLDMWEQEEIIDNLWIRIDLIFYFWRCLIEKNEK
ncbi:hypothetical protein [Okeania sp.]|uniref:hypothetical protein n=1 Tax=Okeania sp. TaxID=3100323 RepID=UPI002B4AD7A1|nr:hypothetical protein [Okeania sp.]MEB3340912.1 hypothetical protein [Okeania sp.]